jgi:glycosyltransferase involved in cell wall biosynthesis
MARIVVLTQLFPPETAAAARRLGPVLEALARRHEVVVTTLRPSYPSPELYPPGAARATDERLPYRVRRPMAFRPHSRSLFVRAVREHAMAFVLALAAARERADLVLASVPSMFIGPAALVLARAKRAHFVLDVRDLHWQLAAELGKDEPSRPVALALDWLARYMWFVVRRADLVVSATPGITEIVLRAGIPPERVITVANTVSQQVVDELAAVAEPVEKSRPVAGYVGLLGYTQGLDDLLEAAARTPGVDYVLAGDGSMRPSLEARARELGLENVSFAGYLQHDGLVDFYRRADILFVQTRASEYTNATVIPVKLFEYMAASRPIVYAGTGLALDVLARAGCAVVVPPGDPEAIAAAVRELAGDPERRLELGARGRAFVEGLETREQLAEQFAEALSSRLGEDRS